MLRWPVEPMRAAGAAAGFAVAAGSADVRWELKWDGFRIVAWRREGAVRLQFHNGTDLSRYSPDVCGVLVRHLPEGVVVDGEVVSLDQGRGRISFTNLQRRITAGRGLAQEALTRPCHFVAFDLLQDARGRELLSLPLATRRRRLERLFAGAPPQLALCPQTDDEALAQTWFDEWAGTAGVVEGLVAKRADGTYRPGKIGWTKIKKRRSADYIVGGVTGTAAYPSSLLLGRLDSRGQLRFVAQTHPIKATQRRELVEHLQPTPFQGDGAGHPWPRPLPAAWCVDLADRQPVQYQQVEPTVVVEVEVDNAIDGALAKARHRAHHLRVRADLTPADVPPAGTR